MRRLIESPALRQRLIQGGYATARAHTLERQAAQMMAAVNVPSDSIDRRQPDAADRRRVCFVLPSLNGGGAERAAVQVLNGLDRDVAGRSMFLFERNGTISGRCRSLDRSACQRRRRRAASDGRRSAASSRSIART